MPAATELELIDDLLLEWDATDHSKRNARYTLVAFADWLAARGTSLAEAGTADCAAWLAARKEHVAATTLVKNWSQLKAFYATAENDAADTLTGRRSPMARIPKPRAPKYARTKAAQVGEFDALLATFDRRSELGLRNAAMLSLMFRSGVRVGELAGRNLDELDLEARRILIPDAKNDEPRRPPLHPETVTLLRRYLRRRGGAPGPVFRSMGPRRRSERMTTSAIQTMFKRAADKAGVDLSPHTLRRGWFAEYVVHGGDVVTGMHIAGWSREVMPYRYLADRRDETAQVAFDEVAARQTRARRRAG